MSQSENVAVNGGLTDEQVKAYQEFLDNQKKEEGMTASEVALSAVSKTAHGVGWVAGKTYKGVKVATPATWNILKLVCKDFKKGWDDSK